MSAMLPFSVPPQLTGSSQLGCAGGDFLPVVPPFLHAVRRPYDIPARLTSDNGTPTKEQ